MIDSPQIDLGSWDPPSIDTSTPPQEDLFGDIGKGLSSFWGPASQTASNAWNWMTTSPGLTDSRTGQKINFLGSENPIKSAADYAVGAVQRGPANTLLMGNNPDFQGLTPGTPEWQQQMQQTQENWGMGMAGMEMGGPSGKQPEWGFGTEPSVAAGEAEKINEAKMAAYKSNNVSGGEINPQVQSSIQDALGQGPQTPASPEGVGPSAFPDLETGKEDVNTVDRSPGQQPWQEGSKRGFFGQKGMTLPDDFRSSLSPEDRGDYPGAGGGDEKPPLGGGPNRIPSDEELQARYDRLSQQNKDALARGKSPDLTPEQQAEANAPMPDQEIPQSENALPRPSPFTPQSLPGQEDSQITGGLTSRIGGKGSLGVPQEGAGPMGAQNVARDSLQDEVFNKLRSIDEGRSAFPGQPARPPEGPLPGQMSIDEFSEATGKAPKTSLGAENVPKPDFFSPPPPGTQEYANQHGFGESPMSGHGGEPQSGFEWMPQDRGKIPSEPSPQEPLFRAEPQNGPLASSQPVPGEESNPRLMSEPTFQRPWDQPIQKTPGQQPTIGPAATRTFDSNGVPEGLTGNFKDYNSYADARQQAVEAHNTLDKNARDLGTDETRLAAQHRAIDEALGLDKADDKTPPDTIKKVLTAAARLPRYAQVATLHFLRQPLMASLKHPGQAWGAFSDSAKAVVQGQEAVTKLSQEARIRSINNGLDRLGWKPDAGAEEYGVGNPLGKVPVMGGINQFYSLSMDLLRSNVANDLVDSARAMGKQLDQPILDKLSDIINHATGRGDLTIGKGEQNKVVEGFANILNELNFAPKYNISRFQNATDTIGATARGITGRGDWVDSETRGLAARYALAQVAFLGLAALGGAEVNINPTSTGFLRAKVGDTYYDIAGGRAEDIRLIARMVTGSEETASGNNFDMTQTKRGETPNGPKEWLQGHIANPIGGYEQGKLSPWGRFAWESATGQGLGGQDVSLDNPDLSANPIRDILPVPLSGLGGQESAGAGEDPAQVLINTLFSEVGGSASTFTQKPSRGTVRL